MGALCPFRSAAGVCEVQLLNQLPSRSWGPVIMSPGPPRLKPAWWDQRWVKEGTQVILIHSEVSVCCSRHTQSIQIH
jgi:hypothetical protein